MAKATGSCVLWLLPHAPASVHIDGLNGIVSGDERVHQFGFVHILHREAMSIGGVLSRSSKVGHDRLGSFALVDLHGAGAVGSAARSGTNHRAGDGALRTRAPAAFRVTSDLRWTHAPARRR